jgi:hypothetical protein
MALEIPGVRPALFSDESVKKRAVELLTFRHRFRNLYDQDLDPEKTARAHQNANFLVDAFASCHSDFIAKLASIADGLK